MAEVSIKVNIGGRIYPIKVEKGREKLVRTAVEHINQKLADLKQNYAVKDNQDLLAMYALQLSTEHLHNEKKMMLDLALAERLIEVEQFVTDYLDKEKRFVN
jgi:cell division protein ZapA (FtsZ GTPase activity inhibitor)